MYIDCRTISKLRVKMIWNQAVGQVKQSLYRSWHALWVPGTPKLHVNRHINVVRLSDLSTGLLYPQEILLVLISVGGLVDPRTIVRPESICQWKIPMTLPGTDDFTACSTEPRPTASPRVLPPPPLFEVLNQNLPRWAEEKQEKFKDIRYPNRDTFPLSPKYKSKGSIFYEIHWHLPCVSASCLLCKDPDDRSQLQMRGFSHFVTMATYLQSSDISAADMQKLKRAKHALVLLYFSLSIWHRQRDASKYFQNVLQYYSIP